MLKGGDKLYRFGAVVCAGMGGATFAQFPNYVQHYLQRLSGRLDVYKEAVSSYRNMIAECQSKMTNCDVLTLNQLIQKFLDSPDYFFIQMGVKIQNDIALEHSLSIAKEAILNANPLTRFFVWLRYLDLDIAQKTYQDYTWGITLNLETAFYATSGLIFGFLFYFSMVRLLTPWKRISVEKES